MNNPSSSSSSSSLHSLHQQYTAMPSLPLPPPPPPHGVIPNDKESSVDSTSTPRKRTRATPEQLAVLEKTFNVNPSPNNRVREQLSRELGMSERSIQIWFQNRRAKVKNVAKKSSMLHDETLRMQYYASSAAAAACQAAVYHQRQKEGKDASEVMEDPIKSNPDLYYYYYYYYFNQQQQLQQRQKHHHQMHHPYMQQQQQQHQRYHSSPSSSSSSVPPPPISLKSMPPPPPPPPHSVAAAIMDDTTGSISPSDTLKSDPYSQWSKKEIHQQRARAHTIGPYPSNFQHQSNNSKQFRGSSAELSNKNPMIPLSINTSNIVENINYTSMMNTASSLSPSQHEQFASLTVQDLPFYDQQPHLQQQQQQQQQHNQQQLTWTDLPFYEDTSLMMTPTTPSIFTANNNNTYDIPSTSTATTTTTNTTNTQIISAEALQIGTWKRMTFEPNDLSCQFDRDNKLFSWCIQDGISKFKMEFPQEFVQSIKLSPLASRPGWARLEMNVLSTQHISFYMETPQQSWIQCRDYTEDKQASIISLHQLDGPALALKAELESLSRENDYLATIIH